MLTCILETFWNFKQNASPRAKKILNELIDRDPRSIIWLVVKTNDRSPKLSVKVYSDRISKSIESIDPCFEKSNNFILMENSILRQPILLYKITKFQRVIFSCIARSLILIEVTTNCTRLSTALRSVPNIKSILTGLWPGIYRRSSSLTDRQDRKLTFYLVIVLVHYRGCLLVHNNLF